MHTVHIKVYGAFHPVPQTLETALDTLTPLVICDEPFYERTNDMVNIMYEGVYFPVEDALELLERELPLTATGKIDVIDLDAWTLTRHIWEQGKFISSRARDLNSVLAYSGH